MATVSQSIDNFTLSLGSKSSGNNAGHAVIGVENSLIQNGTIDKAKITYTCKGSKKTNTIYAAATARTGYKNSSGGEQWGDNRTVGGTDDSTTTYTDEFIPTKSNDGTYQLLIGAVNNINAAKLDVSFTNISITLEFTPHEHSYTTEIARTPSTCCTKGSVTYQCSCDETTSVELALDPYSHTGGTEIRNAVAATCTATGYTGDTYCKGCGVKFSSGTTIASLGHNYVSSVVLPKEDSHGYTRHTCTRCGHYYDDSYTYLVRWYNENGSTLLETDPAVPYGTMPEYNGATPTKTATAQHSYTHIGWNISPTAEGTTALTAVVANIDYYARFRSDVNKYTVKWVNDDGTVLETDTLVPYGNLPDYNGATPKKPDSADGKYTYTFLGWSAKVEDPPLDESNLPTVTGNITYTAVYLPVVRTYNLDIIAYGCTVEGAVNGTYDYGTKFTIKVKPIFGYEFDRILDETNDVEYTDNEVTFYLNGDVTLLCFCERALAPIFISPEQQVTEVLIQPSTNTIFYVIEGDIPTVEPTVDAVDGWHFKVINDADELVGLVYPLEKLFITDKNGVTTRVY